MAATMPAELPPRASDVGPEDGPMRDEYERAAMEEFTKSRRSKDGLGSFCRPCNQQKMAAAYAARRPRG